MSKIPLSISISSGDIRPIFKQIVDAISIAIIKGELQKGDKLPSVRILGEQLTVNPNTVAKAYSELSSMGLVESRKGLGLFVLGRKQLLNRAERNKRLQQAIIIFINDIVHLGYSDEEVIGTLKEELNQIRRIGREAG